MKYTIAQSNTADQFDDWFADERGTELESDDECEYDVMDDLEIE